MGDLGEQTAVTPVQSESEPADTETGPDIHRFTAMVHPDWEIWGPEGGYVAALHLLGQLRPASGRSP